MEKKNADVWTNDDESKWLGWLDSVFRRNSKKSANINNLPKDAQQFESVVLLGMGGSSLCPEVLAETFGKKQFHILDSTVPAQIKTLENKLNLEKNSFYCRLKIRFDA